MRRKEEREEELLRDKSTNQQSCEKQQLQKFKEITQDDAEERKPHFDTGATTQNRRGTTHQREEIPKQKLSTIT